MDRTNLAELQPTRSSATFCDRCSDLFQEISLSRKSWSDEATRLSVPFHSIQTLLCSAEEGCHFCLFVLHELSTEYVDRLIRELIDSPENAWGQMHCHFTAYTDSTAGNDEPSLFMTLHVSQISLGDGGDMVTVDLNDPNGDFRECASHEDHFCVLADAEPSLAPHTDSPQTMRDIHNWIACCSSHHRECAQKRAARRCSPPSRLLDLSSLRETSRVRLRETSSISGEVKYATLSYSWGTGKQFTLLSSNYLDFLGGIVFQDLARTFRDAMELTIRLGLSYIWIDSMCIVQDSPEDWETEAFRMADIYHGSFINISAREFFSPHGGLFQKRDALSLMPVEVPLSLREFGWKNDQLTIWHGQSIRNVLDGTPLSSRAWTVQERLLAPRTLHFLRNQVIWECYDLLASESDPEAGHLWERSFWADNIVTSDQELLWHTKWREVVAVFTQADLTYQSDKLIAISGIAKYISSTEIAKHIASLWPGNTPRYYAGIWGHCAEVSLLWYISGGTRGIADERAPTWSWGRRKGEVECYASMGHIQLLASVVEIKADSIGGDEFGPVDGGVIRIRGPISRVTLRFAEGNGAVVEGTGSRLRLRDWEFDDGAPLVAHDTNASAGLLLLGIAMDGDGDPFVTLQGLILVPTGQQRGEYVRVGYWMMEDSDHGLGDVDNMPQEARYGYFADKIGLSTLEKSHFEEDGEEKGVYTITII